MNAVVVSSASTVIRRVAGAAGRSTSYELSELSR